MACCFRTWPPCGCPCVCSSCTPHVDVLWQVLLLVSAEARQVLLLKNYAAA
jgi:hypothetical protein